MRRELFPRRVGFGSTFAGLLPTSARSIYPNKRTFPRLAGHGEFGRVEDGRGSLGPEASAPFPIPACMVLWLSRVI